MANRIYKRSYQIFNSVLDDYKFYFSKINHSPIIVLGHQKTGTSAIAALLARATNKSVTIDFFHKNNTKIPFFREKLFNGELDISKLIHLNKYYFSKDIIKEPELTFYYRDLLSIFPSSKFIFVVRDPKDTIRSILDRLRIPGNITQLQDEHTNSLENLLGWKLALNGKAPDVPGESFIEKLAYRWSLAAKIYLANSQNMTLIRYEDFKVDRVESISILAGKIGLDVNQDISNIVNTQFQFRGNSNVNLLEFFGKSNLQKIENICGQEQKKLGY